MRMFNGVPYICRYHDNEVQESLSVWSSVRGSNSSVIQECYSARNQLYFASMQWERYGRTLVIIFVYLAPQYRRLYDVEINNSTDTINDQLAVIKDWWWSILFKSFQGHFIDTRESLPRLLICGRCRRSWAAATPAKYEWNIHQEDGALAISNKIEKIKRIKLLQRDQPVMNGMGFIPDLLYYHVSCMGTVFDATLSHDF